MFAIIPKKTCPHLELLRPEETPEGMQKLLLIIFHFTYNLFSAIDHKSECLECRTAIENWVCLLCFGTFCSRFINEHNVLHSVSSDHPLTLSLSDLSVWCYKCEAYIDNPQCYKFKNLVHRSKFDGEELVWSYRDFHIDLAIEDDSE